MESITAPPPGRPSKNVTEDLTSSGVTALSITNEKFAQLPLEFVSVDGGTQLRSVGRAAPHLHLDSSFGEAISENGELAAPLV